MLSTKETLKFLKPLRRSMARAGKETTDEEALAYAEYLKSRPVNPDFDPSRIYELYATLPPEMQKVIRQADRARMKLFHTCGFCKTGGREFKKCSVCKKVRYCSRECQKDDWKKHKPICY